MESTPLFTWIQEQSTSRFKDLIHKHLDPWRNFYEFDARSKKSFTDTKPNGDIISYSGVTFSGSVVRVFWSNDYIPAYLNELITLLIDDTYDKINETKSEPVSCFDELKEELHLGCYKVLAEMSKIDYSLRKNKNILSTRNEEIRLNIEEKATDHLFHAFKVNIDKKIEDKIKINEQITKPPKKQVSWYTKIDQPLKILSTIFGMIVAIIVIYQFFVN